MANLMNSLQDQVFSDEQMHLEFDWLVKLVSQKSDYFLADSNYRPAPDYLARTTSLYYCQPTFAATVAG
jgi:hypothetical protein